MQQCCYAHSQLPPIYRNIKRITHTDCRRPQVMTVVKSLSEFGITTCATIHSPSPYCFGLFDRMMLLLRGEVVYFGPNGAWTNRVPFRKCIAARLLPASEDLEMQHTHQAWLTGWLACIAAGSEAISYFQNQCPSNIEGLRDGENTSEWIVDLTTQVPLLRRLALFVDRRAFCDCHPIADKSVSTRVKPRSTAG